MSRVNVLVLSKDANARSEAIKRRFAMRIGMQFVVETPDELREVTKNSPAFWGVVVVESWALADAEGLAVIRGVLAANPASLFCVLGTEQAASAKTLAQDALIIPSPSDEREFLESIELVIRRHAPGASQGH